MVGLGTGLRSSLRGDVSVVSLAGAPIQGGGVAPSFPQPPDYDNLQVYHRSDYLVFKDINAASPSAADGDVVGRWGDLTANNNWVGQTDPNLQPKFKLNQLPGGKPSILFDPSGDSDLLLYSMPFAQPQKTMYAGIRIKTTATLTILSGGAGSLTWRIQNQKSALVNTALVDIGVGTVNVPLNAWTHLNASWDGSSGVLRTNQQADATLTGNGPAQGLTQSIDGGAPGEGFNGDIAYILVYNGIHNTAMRQSIEAWAAGQFGFGV